MYAQSRSIEVQDEVDMGNNHITVEQTCFTLTLDEKKCIHNKLSMVKGFERKQLTYETKEDHKHDQDSVSYTHLTLPTICSV